MNLGESLKDSWSTQNTEPPIPHAEEQTIQKFAETINLLPNELRTKLASKGIRIDSDSATIKEISKQNNLSPSEIYKWVLRKQLINQLVFRLKEEVMEEKRLSKYTELKINTDEGLNRLRAKGINADKDEKLKDVAAKNNLAPIDIANTITGVTN